MNFEYTQPLIFIAVVLYCYLMYKWCFKDGDLNERIKEQGLSAVKKPILLTLIMFGFFMFSPVNTTQPRSQGVNFNMEFNNRELQKSERAMYGDTIEQRLEEGVTAEEILNETEEENPNE